MFNLSEPTRAWLYRVLTAAVPLLVAYGAIDEQVAPLIVALGASLFGFGLASSNTSTKPEG